MSGEPAPAPIACAIATSPGTIDRAAAGLHPAYFSLVMATGIVSLAAWIESGGVGGHSMLAALARGMFWLNFLFFAALWALTLIRIARHRTRLIADFSDHNKSVGFFTMVPGACVLGTQALLIQGMTGLAWGLWILGTILWAVLTYTIFTVLTVKSVKPTLADGISGGWLLSVVATQAVAVLAGQLASAAGAEGVVGHGHSEGLLFIALVMWLGGAMLYIWIIALIFYRYTFFPFKPSDLAPPYWINMGAMAISTLAGTTLLLATKDRDSSIALVRDLLPFIKGATLLFWATATWWIPMLLILGVWRHIVKRFPLRYDPLYWGAVFPLGMYSVATARMNSAIELPPSLGVLPPVFCYVSITAWALAVTGMGYAVCVSARVRK
ncbi:MAG: tellurite resistance/C4-dicarboxylate transporter family protein [Phycisphaerales bacterium]|nr:tellurite resistance/C4-dicarboxylate transporter family protein [Phycisphaerales bacterium]